MTQVYDRPVHQLIRDLIAERLSSEGATLTRREALAWFRARYPKVRPGTVAAHLLRLATNDEVRLHYDPKPEYDDVLYKTEPGLYRRYDPKSDPAPIRAPQAKNSGDAVEPEKEDNE